MSIRDSSPFTRPLSAVFFIVFSFSFSSVEAGKVGLVTEIYHGIVGFFKVAGDDVARAATYGGYKIYKAESGEDCDSEIRYRTLSDRVYVHESADIDSVVLAYLDRNDLVCVIAKQDQWLRIKEGWAEAKFFAADENP